MKDRSFNSFASHMIKLSVNETKWRILLARTRALIPFIWISISDFGPEKLSGLCRYGPLSGTRTWDRRIMSAKRWPLFHAVSSRLTISFALQSAWFGCRDSSVTAWADVSSPPETSSITAISCTCFQWVKIYLCGNHVLLAHISVK